MAIPLEVIRRLPKTDLHLHLDGSLRTRTVWDLAQEQGIKLKARNIRKFVSTYIGKRSFCLSPDRIDVVGEDYRKAVMAMLYQIRLAQNERWQTTSRQAALYWNQVMREKILWQS